MANGDKEGKKKKKGMIKVQIEIPAHQLLRNFNECACCHSEESDEILLVRVKDAAICADCLDEGAEQLYNSMPGGPPRAETLEIVRQPAKPFTVLPPAPKEIKASLDEHVIKQDRMKKTMSVAVTNHYKRVGQDPAQGDAKIEKSNILMIGATGTGKTLLAETIAETIGVPFAIADATGLTQAGYIGKDVESIILALYEKAGGDPAATERGIIYIDELDKLARSKGGMGPDVGGAGVQRALLKIMEGCEVDIPVQSGDPHSPMVKINTKNILFICGGSFADDGRGMSLTDHIQDRLGKKEKPHSTGFLGTPKKSASAAPSKQELLMQATPKDFEAFGLIPEIIGRLPVTGVLDTLGVEELVRILEEPKNALLKQKQALFAMDGIRLVFTQAAKQAVAEKAAAMETGGRSLRTIVDAALEDVSFELPDLQASGVTQIVIDEDVIKGTALPQYSYNKIQPSRALG